MAAGKRKKTVIFTLEDCEKFREKQGIRLTAQNERKEPDTEQQKRIPEDMRKRFESARDKIVGQKREKNGIGTLSEKTMHAVLKNFYEPDVEKQEVKIASCVADIFTGEEIIEIQTRNFDKLREKLTRFLPLYPVTVVYPIPREKWIIWIDQTTGEFSGKRKSPVKGSPYMAFREFYKIKPFLTDKNLKLKIAMLDTEEYRLLNGWSKDGKKGSSRFDRIPIALADEYTFERKEDYIQLIPYGLPEPFTAKEFAGAIGVRKENASLILHVLSFVDAVERTGKRGNSYLYRVVES